MNEPWCDLESIAAWYMRYEEQQGPLRFFDIPIALDPRMPHDEVQLRDNRGRVCGRILVAKDEEDD